jgi:hypothetical protein
VTAASVIFGSIVLYGLGSSLPNVKMLAPKGCALLVLTALCAAATNPSGWYTSRQAAAGAKAYQKSCASCHGAALQGGMGPALVGKPFWQAYGGKKISTLWSGVHTQMPMMAPNSVPVTNSINIMAFLLRKNGIPAGTTPLDDTVDLSKVLPSK